MLVVSVLLSIISGIWLGSKSMITELDECMVKLWGPSVWEIGELEATFVVIWLELEMTDIESGTCMKGITYRVGTCGGSGTREWKFSAGLGIVLRGSMLLLLKGKKVS